ncbi:hypothetical protein ColTof4_14415 [Colletotrichum tofieldiae]|nr:hypothetical protein ColTof4_14415 [Colletotrichum tofieldiae]
MSSVTTLRLLDAERTARAAPKTTETTESAETAVTTDTMKWWTRTATAKATRVSLVAGRPRLNYRCSKKKGHEDRNDNKSKDKSKDGGKGKARVKAQAKAKPKWKGKVKDTEGKTGGNRGTHKKSSDRRNGRRNSHGGSAGDAEASGSRHKHGRRSLQNEFDTVAVGRDTHTPALTAGEWKRREQRVRDLVTGMTAQLASAVKAEAKLRMTISTEATRPARL